MTVSHERRNSLRRILMRSAKYSPLEKHNKKLRKALNNFTPDYNNWQRTVTLKKKSVRLSGKLFRNVYCPKYCGCEGITEAVYECIDNHG